MDFMADLSILFADSGVDVTLWPGTEREIRHERGGLYDGPFELVQLGDRVGHMSLAPMLTMRAEHAGAVVQGDRLTVHPSPALGLAGGDFKVSQPQPDGQGLIILELKRA